MPELIGFDLSGASRGTVTGVKTDGLKLEVSGASRINISGEVRDLNADLSGASHLEAENLKTEKTNVEASGASKATVFVIDSLNADASGASRIIYAGNPREVKKDASGASSVSAK